MVNIYHNINDEDDDDGVGDPTDQDNNDDIDYGDVTDTLVSCTYLREVQVVAVVVLLARDLRL